MASEVSANLSGAPVPASSAHLFEASAHAAPPIGQPESSAERRVDYQRLGELAYQTFVGELPHLLNEHAGKWIGYRGDRRLGIAPTRTELHRQFVGQGMHVDEFLICCIEPQLEEVEMGVELAD